MGGVQKTEKHRMNVRVEPVLIEYAARPGSQSAHAENLRGRERGREREREREREGERDGTI
jgi:hypothetical protein